MNNHTPQLRPVRYTNHTAPTVWDKPPTRWQRLTCKHTSAQPVYTSLDQEPGNFRAVLAHYYCHYCGRKLSNPHRRQRVNPLIPLFLIALAILITYWWWL